MWRAIYRTQGGLAAFGGAAVYALISQMLPMAFLGEEFGLDLRQVDMYRLGSVADASGMFMGAYAMLAGLTCATVCWAADQRTNHVYALSLPMARWRYALLRWSMGLVHVTATTLLFYLAGVVLAALTTLPEGLHAYPGALAVRFGLATFTSYSLIFGLYTLYLNLPQQRRYTAILVATGAVIVTIALVLAYPSVGRDIRHALIATSWSPFHFISGTWALFDV